MLGDAAELRDLLAPPAYRLEALKGDRRDNTAFASTTSGEFVFAGAGTALKMLRLLTPIEASLMNKMRAIHPGEILREEFMMPMGMSAHALAFALRVAAPRINDIVREKRGVTPDTALRLARYFNSTPQFWLNLQGDKVPASIVLRIKRRCSTCFQHQWHLQRSYSACPLAVNCLSAKY
jgi:antitoxin HigA-1